MNLRLYSEITITQQPSASHPTRTKSFVLNFCNQIQISDTWVDMTNTAKFIIPKKIYFKDATGNLVTWDGQSIAAGSNPLLFRGDKVKIVLGYRYLQDTDTLKENIVFEGFISKVNPKQPLEIECEDNMWLFKQLSTPDKLYKSTDVETMITSIINGAKSTATEPMKTNLNGFKVRNSIKTSLGDFRTETDTIASVLQRLKDDYSIYSYFKGNELRCSGIVYYPEDQKKHSFKFQENYNGLSFHFLFLANSLKHQLS